MKPKELKEHLKSLGFKEEEKSKLTVEIDGYCISVVLDETDTAKSYINYGSDIKIWHKSSSRFHQYETLVVLECVMRLLRKKYPPKCIELEKTWSSGHGRSGRLDVLVKSKSKGVFAMIECKTWGEEYEKERNNLVADGGQLFTYLMQERSAKHIILYTSRITKAIEYQSESIDVSKLTGTNNEELHQSWDKTFLTGGIFAPLASCFNTANVEIKKKDLKELDDKSGIGLFHSFAEILRRHAISDKSNAFNKIFNLFVCKIYDEDTHTAEDILDFQWKPSDDYAKLIIRLSELYRKGIIDYLDLPVESEYFSPYSEFSFVDIYNKESYDNNFKIVREIVELLQRYQIKYTQKHQFLGDFFEDLLNSGIKQEAGQFFTPTPLARFFMRSMPVECFVNDAISTKEQHIIPSVIDFACGAGHFLTEAIDEVEEIIKETDYTKLVGRAQKHFLAIRENYYWAKDYIYGIEKDYRLSKTTKIAMFLNGDGDAIIINSDGLGSFSKNPTYRGVLHKDKQTKELSHFDILLSNPPFSISGFSKDLIHGKTDFNLYNRISNKSTEIECLFLERAYQLLREGGCMGIILPLSILNNESSVYIGARRILLIGFSLTGIIELRDKTFKPTNTTTVSIFARKRTKADIKSVTKRLLNLSKPNNKKHITKLATTIDIEVDVLSNAIDTEEQKLKQIENDGDLKHILEIDNNLFQAIFHLLNNDATILLGYSGEKKDQEHFLGYRFSKSRGQEGIEILKDNDGNIDSRLYSSVDRNDKTKLSYYIRSHLLNISKPIDDSIKKNLKEYPINMIVDKRASIVIDNPSKYFVSRHISLESTSLYGDFIDDYPQIKISLREMKEEGTLFYTSGLTYSKKDSEVPYQTEKRVLTASNILLNEGVVDISQKLIYLREEFIIPEEVQPHQNDIIISNASGSINHLGKVAWVSKALIDYAVGGFLGIYRFKDPDLAKAVYYRLKSKKFRTYVAGLRGQNINNLDLDKIDTCEITIPSDLKEFIKKMREAENG